MGVLDFFKKAADTYKEYKGVVDTAASVGKAYLDYKDAKRRNELEEAAYSDYMKAAEAAGQEAQAAIDLNLTPMTISGLPTKKADVTDFTKATFARDGGIMKLKDGTNPNEGIAALRKVRPDVVEKMGFEKGGGPGIEALRKKAPEVVKRMGFKEGMNEDMVEEKTYTQVSYEPGNYTEEEIEAYENYKYDMNEQKPGFPIMEIDDFLRFYMSPYSKKKNNMDMKIASAPDIDDSRNDLAMMLFGKTLDLLSEEELEILNEEAQRLMNKFMASGGIASFAKGGRIGLSSGANERYEAKIKELMDKGLSRELAEAIVLSDLSPEAYTIPDKKAEGGRVKYAQGSGGIMDMGGMEKDYRFTGGFVPIGEYERKDDVPARLSKNEFVFTADAVRAAGGGSINKGAQRMYNTMKQLEARPEAKQMMA